MPVSVGTRAEETIVGQVIEAVEEAISIQGLRASDVPAGAKNTEAFSLSREEWQARVARAEALILGPFFQELEIARVLRQRPVAEVARRAHLSPRMLQYHRHRKARLTLRTMIALAEACGVEFTVTVRTKRPRAEHPNSVKPMALIHSHDTTVEGPPDVR